MNIASAIFGPLVEPECRRALARGWLILVRTLAALAILSVTLIDLWYAWVCVYSDQYYQPYRELRAGLLIVEGMLVTVALVLAPAVLAGSLAGENERGALGLLLTTRITSREIVSARFLGKLTQVVMILLAGLPAVILLAALTGMNLDVVATLIAVPAALAFGAGGLSTAVSAISRRGRDALLTVYLVELVFLLVPIIGSLGWSPGGFAWIEVLNPYASLGSLIYQEQVTDSLLSIGLWSALGLGGLALASWRLAPACLGRLDGARVGRVRKRRARVPVIDERPMLWKELHIERSGTLGGFGWWVGAALTLLLAGGSLAMAGIMAWDSLRAGDLGWFQWAQSVLSVGVGRSSLLIGWLIEWAVGLRAAVAIASERERGTWDAILTSPLEGKEIIRAKLWGCLYALRWLFAAAFLAWTISLASQAMSAEDYASRVIGTFLGAAFMAAVGVRSSLASATATRAMAVTIGIWLGSLVALSIVSAILTAIVGAIIFMAMVGIFDTAGLTALNMRWFGNVMQVVNLVTGNVPYLVLTLILVSHTRILFDRLAGRRAGGRFAVAADRFLFPKPAGPAVEQAEHAGAPGSLEPEGASSRVGD